MGKKLCSTSINPKCLPSFGLHTDEERFHEELERINTEYTHALDVMIGGDEVEELQKPLSLVDEIKLLSPKGNSKTSQGRN